MNPSCDQSLRIAKRRVCRQSTLRFAAPNGRARGCRSPCDRHRTVVVQPSPCQCPLRTRSREIGLPGDCHPCRECRAPGAGSREMDGQVRRSGSSMMLPASMPGKRLAPTDARAGMVQGVRPFGDRQIVA
jgi:hypothetical protein